MKAVMWPAIKFMSSLGYAAKFGLISLLFMVPLIVLGGQVFFAAFDSLGKTSKELDGLHTSELLYEYAHKLENFRDLAAVVPYQSNNEHLNAQVSQILEALPKELAALEQALEGQQTQTAIQQWRKEYIQRLNITGEHRQPTFADQIRYYQNAINEFYILIRQHNQETGIALDADSTVQRLMSILTDLPKINQVFGLAHGAGIYAFIEQYLQSTTFDMANNVYDQLVVIETDVQLLNNNAKATGNNNLIISAEAASQALLRLRTKLDEEVISAASIEGDWQDFDMYYREQANTLARVESAALPLIKSTLQQRYQQQRTRIAWLAFVLISALSVILYLYLAFFMSIRYTIKRFTKTAAEVARGDLTQTVRFYGKDEMAHMRDAFNSMVDNIRSTLTTVKDGAVSVSSNINDVENIANRSREAVQSQLEEIKQISDVISAMADHAGQIAAFAQDAERAALDGSDKTNKSAQEINQVIKQIQRLSQEMGHSMEAVNRLAASSKSISNILVTIKNIAEQTNLLALNAAIEAARAGEHGRGFAVVADEVRTLASRSQASAQEIEGLIHEVQDNIISTVDTMEANRSMIAQAVEQTGRVTATLNEVQQGMGAIRSKTSDIATTSNEQKQNALSIERNLEQVRAKGQQTADNADGTVAEVRKTQSITDNLTQQVSQFRV